MDVIALNTTIFNKADVLPFFFFLIYPLFLVLALLM